MDWEVIGALGQWFAGFATLSVVFYAIWQEKWKRPKLVLDFQNDRDVKSQTNTEGLNPSTLSRWLRVRVVNANGRRVARNCRAYLVGIEKVGVLSQFEDLFPNDLRELGWTHDLSAGALGRDLLPGIPHWIDIAAAIEGRGDLSVCVRPSWGLKAPGDFIFTIQVSAEGSEAEVIQVRVHWDGKWQSLTGERIWRERHQIQ